MCGEGGRSSLPGTSLAKRCRRASHHGRGSECEEEAGISQQQGLWRRLCCWAAQRHLSLEVFLSLPAGNRFESDSQEPPRTPPPSPPLGEGRAL